MVPVVELRGPRIAPGVRGLYRHRLERVISGPSGASTVRFRSRDMLGGSGMRRSTLLKLSSMELHEVAHVRRCFAGELAQGVRHAVETPLPGQLGQG